MEIENKLSVDQIERGLKAKKVMFFLNREDSIFYFDYTNYMTDLEIKLAMKVTEEDLFCYALFDASRLLTDNKDRLDFAGILHDRTRHQINGLAKMDWSSGKVCCYKHDTATGDWEKIIHILILLCYRSELLYQNMLAQKTGNAELDRDRGLSYYKENIFDFNGLKPSVTSMIDHYLTEIERLEAKRSLNEKK